MTAVVQEGLNEGAVYFVEPGGRCMRVFMLKKRCTANVKFHQKLAKDDGLTVAQREDLTETANGWRRMARALAVWEEEYLSELISVPEWDVVAIQAGLGVSRKGKPQRARLAPEED